MPSKIAGRRVDVASKTYKTAMWLRAAKVPGFEGELLGTVIGFPTGPAEWAKMLHRLKMWKVLTYEDVRRIAADTELQGALVAAHRLGGKAALDGLIVQEGMAAWLNPEPKPPFKAELELRRPEERRKR